METETPYIQALQAKREYFQHAIETLMEKFQVQMVGNGYTDLILPISESLKLIEELTKMQVALKTITYWCLCTPESEKNLGCPHGLGGPRNRFGEGWYSEFCTVYYNIEEGGVNLDDISLEPKELVKLCNQIAANHLLYDLPKKSFFRECIHSGLWLHVPDDWKSLKYGVRNSL